LKINSNEVGIVNNSAVYDFDPGSTTTQASIDFNFVDTSGSDLRHVYLSQRWMGDGNGRFIAGVARLSGVWTLLIQNATGAGYIDAAISISSNTWYTLTVTNDGSEVTAQVDSTTILLSNSTNASESSMALEIYSGAAGTDGIKLDNLCVGSLA